MRAAFSLVSRSDATDRNEVADAEEIAFERGETRNADNTRMRPARKTAGALTTAASVDTAVDAGGTIGACFAGPRPNSVARSHVGNGAVKGARTKTTSQPATNRESIDGSAISRSKLHATRQPGDLQFSGENPGRVGSETRPKCMAPAPCDIIVGHLCFERVVAVATTDASIQLQFW